MPIRKLGILTSGGDSPGMNSAVRAAALTAQNQGIIPIGIRRGYQGILDRDLIPLDDTQLSPVLAHGGTLLQSSRCKAFYTEEGRQTGAQLLRDQEIDALIVVGGDGSLTGARELHRLKIPVIGLPGTIDNDIYGTDIAIGVDTALNTIMQMADRITDTARSHQRCFLIEVMGRRSGYLALSAALSCGATAAIIPEFRVNLKRLKDRLSHGFKARPSDSILFLAEGVASADEFERRFQELDDSPSSEQEFRKSVLGHVQRGGSPSHFDRLLASRMGELAVNALVQGESGVMTALKRGRLTVVDFDEVLSRKKLLPNDLIRLARHLGLEFGDVVEV
ncbi:MAG: ATP-dependent 6-phosphofructokinase [Verrucomicrobiales bacterium]